MIAYKNNNEGPTQLFISVQSSIGNSMNQAENSIRNVSDTALWVAVYRAHESERPDALFRDPFAKRLAGERGEEIAASMPFSGRDSWPFVMRTLLFDQFIAGEVERGVDAVINLGTGLDARPYRMALPSSLHWFEADLPQIIDYKEEILAGEKPACAVERIRLNLANVRGRGQLFTQLGSRAEKALIITEGVLAYLSPEEVGLLAQDLAAVPSFERWVLDLSSPGLMRMIQKKVPQLGQAGAPLKFGPAEGPGFFARHGWKTLDVHSLFKAAARVRRLSFVMRLMALLPESRGAQGSRPWSGVCLFSR
jgi:methyltransferase (TIGR00027 family)